MDGVQNRENRERHAVHSSYIWLGGLQGAAAVFAALLVGVLPQIIPELFNPDSLGQFVNGGLAAIIIVLLFLSTVIVSLAASLIYRLVSYKHIWYEFGDEEFSFYSGIFNKKRVHVPYRRIQSVDQTASLLQRVFGVCTVRIDTAGGASNRAVSVPFLRKADAEALRADLFARKSAAVGAPFREADAPSSFGNVLDAPAEVWDDVRGVFAGSEVDTGRISFQYGITNSELILTGLSNNTTLVLVVVGIIGVFSQVADFVSQMAGEAGGAVAEVLADASLALFGNSLIALIVVGLVFAIKYALKVPDIRYKFDQAIIKLKPVGPLVVKIYTARFGSTLASLYSSGIPMVECLAKSSNILNNLYVSKKFETVIDEVKQGEALSVSIQRTGIFESMFTSIIYVGEESGALDSILAKSAAFYQEEADEAVSRLVGLIEPVMIIFMGTAIGLVIAGILPAIYNSMGNIT